MNTITIKQDACIACGLCAQDCPNGCISLADGTAHASDAGCIECGHCYAVCPEHAIEMNGYDDADEPTVPMTEVDADVLLAAIKSRRSIRRFTTQAVEDEKVRKILEAGRYAPTGANAQDVSFTILGGRQDEAERICVRLFRTGKKIASRFIGYLERIEIGDDFFFKGAPVVIVVSGTGNIDAGLASSYMELMAESLGLGVLYSGFFVACAKFSSKLRRLLNLPKGHKVASCLVIGYPDVRYQRIPPRKELQATTL